MSRSDQEAIEWNIAEDEYGRNLSPEDNSNQDQPSLVNYFEGESIIPGGFLKVNESNLAEGNILQMLDEDLETKPQRFESTIKKKVHSKERSRKKNSLSKNRQSTKDSFVMKNTFENLSNRMMAKSNFSIRSAHESVRDTTNPQPLSDGKDSICKESTSLKNLDRPQKSPGRVRPEKKASKMEPDGYQPAKSGNPNHLKLHKDLIVQRKFGHGPLFANILIERRDSPVSPPHNLELPMQMKTEVISLRKASEIDRDIDENVKPKRNVCTQERGPVKIMKPVDITSENSVPSFLKTAAKRLPCDHSKKRRRSAVSKDVSAEGDGSLKDDRTKRKTNISSKTSVDKKPSQPIHHFRTINEVLFQGASNQMA
jgi:hypothetical protein